MGPVPTLVEDLRAELAPDRVRAEPLELSLYGHDASIVEGGSAAAVVCFPLSTEEVQSCVRVARAHGRPFTARGAGTGLAGGAVPLGEPVVIVTTKMNRILSVDAEERVAWVEPGVINLDLTRALQVHGLHFAPDPSSQQACSIGGNVANNSGGPHCLAYGVTSAHVLAVEVVLPDGNVAVLGGLEPEPDGYDLRSPLVSRCDSRRILRPSERS
jgi:glycolate oxidase